jgi:hypothetical protein
MTEKLLKILKDPKYIKCWYPSGGTNFVALNYWSKNIGNEIHPKHFIFTDGIYSNEDFEIYLSSISELYNIDISDIKFKKVETTLKLFPNSFNLDYINKLEQRKIAWMKEGTEDEIELKGLGLIKFDEELELIEEFKKHFFINKNASLFYFYFNDILICLINCSNEDFYNYCINESISLDTIMLFRHKDYEFINSKEELIIKNLGVKEGIGSSSYMEVGKESLVETNIFWESDYNANPQAHKVAFIRYLI